ncbi:hypothetical protein GSI_11429 [Ganoderma sinense ZZ0214-1]|uniref:Uncharacterized protein n=1 Tax=Ganoderma sinense ZZ0214-1 TaxID=1077348 RepID=A0A2G8RVZ3_9APHY|nr:hypothetical protein GSI_11429 [Ganoderma sinense ZZ0214-1]
MCRSEDENPMKTAIPATQVGHATGMSLMKAVDRWSKMHSFTCDIITHAETVGEGDWRLPASGTRVLLFGLVSRTPRDPAGAQSPSAEFTIDTHYICPQRVYIEHGIYIVASQWTPASCHRRAELAADMRAKEEARDGKGERGPKFAGVMPVTTYLVGTGMVMEDPCCVYYPHGFEPGARVDMLTLFGLKLLVYLCLEVINMGFVLRPREAGDTSSTLPRIGTYVQRKKKWRWQPAEPERAWSEVAKVMQRKYFTFLSPSDIFTTYYKLWPYGMPGNSLPKDEMD